MGQEGTLPHKHHEDSTDDVVSIKVKQKVTEEKKRLTEHDYTKLKILGKGSFGKVVLVLRKQSNKLYVMKILDKKQIVKRGKDCIKTIKAERFLLAGIQHPFCIYLRATFSTRKKLFFILDYINGGDLEFLLKKKKRFNENMVRFYAAECLLALKYLHSNGILHRDLKLSNILLTQSGHIRVTDFGLSYFFGGKDEKPKQVCGTIEYVAPEVIRNYGKPFDKREGYDFCVDFWSVGIMLYEMIYGKTPFSARTVKEVLQGVLHSQVVFPEKPKWVSRQTKDLITKLLEKDKRRRLGSKGDADTIMKHPFFDGVEWEKMLKREIPPPYKPKIKDALDLGNFDSKIEEEVRRSEEGEDSLDDSVDHAVFGTFGFNRENAMNNSIVNEVDENLREMYRQKVIPTNVKEQSLMVKLKDVKKKIGKRI